MPVATNGRRSTKPRLDALSPVSNDAEGLIALQQPYVAEATIQGMAPLLFHRWSVEAVEEQAKAPKGSAGKKTDNLEAYVYRTPSGHLAIPGEYFRMAIVQTARFRQDPRSPRKSAVELFKAGVFALDDLCSLGTKAWDYLDRRRVMIQRNGLTRVRPAMLPGWQVTCRFQVLLPEYISPQALHEALVMAGRLIGVGDFRPTYGRFQVARFQTNGGS